MRGGEEDEEETSMLRLASSSSSSLNNESVQGEDQNSVLSIRRGIKELRRSSPASDVKLAANVPRKRRAHIQSDQQLSSDGALIRGRIAS